ncbi:sugar ABC transporter ATP-binding protein [Kutzneria sp. NPDC052558]|uniref:sugar ABC transporter ATP-binding protein n=1 Tax=Kutzneria sp. NPDC052558 TaxID=3364121 RepID=UPI0037CC7B2A
MNAVEASDITKRFGQTVALNDVHITVADGETHALVGRNGAGKSTLVSMLTGLNRPDSGRITFRGEPAPALSDRQAWRTKVACVYQKSTIIPTLTVAENLFINRQNLDGGPVINWSRLRRTAAEKLSEYGVDVDPNAEAATLTVEQRQLVEIARALSFGAKFIILDEPTAQLDGPAIERLFERMRSLRAAGVTFLFISHHLQEIFEICQTVTVFRDARHIVTSPVAGLSKDQLVEAMTGEAVGLGAGASRPPVGSESILDVRNLALDKHFSGINLSIRRGEVVGVAGSGSSGKVELGEVIVGLRKADAGTVAVSGKTLKPGSVPAALAGGVGFVPEDRHKEGFVPGLSIAENATFPITGRLGRFGAISGRRRTAVAEKMIGDLAIKTSGPDQDVADLSGGNQQKVVMARALSSDPALLVLMDPTAGVDVKSKENLLDAVDRAATAGTAVLVISDELDDLRPCDRVLVMFHGSVAGEFPAGWTDNELVSVIEGIGESSGE